MRLLKISDNQAKMPPGYKELVTNPNMRSLIWQILHENSYLKLQLGFERRWRQTMKIYNKRRKTVTSLNVLYTCETSLPE